MGTRGFCFFFKGRFLGFSLQLFEAGTSMVFLFFFAFEGHPLDRQALFVMGTQYIISMASSVLSSRAFRTNFGWELGP